MVKTKAYRASGILDAHQRLLVSLIVGILAFAIFKLAIHLRLVASIVAGWDAFAFTTLLLAWLRIVRSDARTSVRTAKLQASSRAAIFSFVVVGAVASLCAVAILLGSAKELGPMRLAEHIVLAGGTVVLSWCLIHTIFALQYAHLFYRLDRDAPDGAAGKGLEFPSEPHPDFLDFAYFSFIIGMTCQVSDVEVSSRQIRRLALVHGLLAFIFNTVILAFSINLISGLL